MKTFHTWRGRLQAMALTGAAIALAAASGAAARQEAAGRAADRIRGPIPFAHLNLSADQRTSIRTIFDKHRETNEPLRGELRAARESLRAAVFASATPDTAQIEQLTTQVTELEARALRSRIAAEVEVAAVLTDEQRQKMAATPPMVFHERIGPGPWD